MISGEELEKKKKDTDGYSMELASGKVSSNRNDDEKGSKFVKVVLWALSQTNVSANSIQQECKVSNNNAKQYYENLQSLGVLGEVGERGRRKVLPQSIEEISGDLKDILFHYNISDDEIMDAINKRVKQ